MPKQSNKYCVTFPNFALYEVTFSKFQPLWLNNVYLKEELSSTSVFLDYFSYSQTLYFFFYR